MKTDRKIELKNRLMKELKSGASTEYDSMLAEAASIQPDILSLLDYPYPSPVALYIACTSGLDTAVRTLSFYGSEIDSSIILTDTRDGSEYTGDEIIVAEDSSVWKKNRVSDSREQIFNPDFELYRMTDEGPVIIRDPEELENAVIHKKFLGFPVGKLKHFRIGYLFSIPQRQLLARYGSESHRDFLMNDVWQIRAAVARYGNDRQRSVLALDEVPNVRLAVIRYGSDSQRNLMLNDPMWYNRAALAEYGNREIREKLSRDPSDYVRISAVRYGDDKLRTEMISDASWQVRETIAQYGSDSNRDLLLTDSSEDVRQTVARFGNLSQLRKLSGDANESVRKSVDTRAMNMDWIIFCGSQKLDLVRCTVTNRTNGHTVPLNLGKVSPEDITHSKAADLLSGKNVIFGQSRYILSLHADGYRIEPVQTSSSFRTNDQTETGRSPLSPVSCSEAEP